MDVDLGLEIETDTDMCMVPVLVYGPGLYLHLLTDKVDWTTPCESLLWYLQHLIWVLQHCSLGPTLQHCLAWQLREVPSPVVQSWRSGGVIAANCNRFNPVLLQPEFHLQLTKQFKIMVLLNCSNSIKVSNIKSTVSWLSYIAFILHLIYDYTMQFTAGLLMQDIKCIGCNLDSVTTLTPAECPHVNASIFFMFCFDPRYKNAHIQHPSPSPATRTLNTASNIKQAFSGYLLASQNKMWI